MRRAKKRPAPFRAGRNKLSSVRTYRAALAIGVPDPIRSARLAILILLAALAAHVVSLLALPAFLLLLAGLTLAAALLLLTRLTLPALLVLTVPFVLVCHRVISSGPSGGNGPGDHRFPEAPASPQDRR
jgi:hypothetical protein